MIRNVGAQNSTKMMINDIRKYDTDMAGNVERDGIKQSNRIDELKKQIVNGEYQIDLRRTAERITQELKPVF